jgi:hypothetical protein
MCFLPMATNAATCLLLIFLVCCHVFINQDVLWLKNGCRTLFCQCWLVMDASSWSLFCGLGLSLCYISFFLCVITSFNYFCCLYCIHLYLHMPPFHCHIIPFDYRMVLYITCACYLFTAVHCPLVSWFKKTVWFCGRLVGNKHLFHSTTTILY